MQLLILSASANKLSKLKERAEEYASLIMEELDPENLGYIEVKSLPLLLLSINDFLTMLLLPFFLRARLLRVVVGEWMKGEKLS